MKVPILLLLTFIFLAFDYLLATPQIPDVVEYKGKSYPVLWGRSPLEKQWVQLSEKIETRGGFVACTACWRGYIADWSISNNWLYLCRVTVPARKTQGFGREVQLATFDNSWSNQVKAVWFTGEITCPLLAADRWQLPYYELPLLYRVFQIHQGQVQSKGYRIIGWRTIKPYLLTLMTGLILLSFVRWRRNSRQRTLETH